MKIAIIGNNITANSMSLYLKSLGIESEIFGKIYTKDEKNAHTAKMSTRTMAISLENIKIIEQFSDNITENAGIIQKVLVFDSEVSKIPDLELRSEDFSYEKIGYIINYNSLCSKLSTTDIQELRSFEEKNDKVFINDTEFDLVIITEATSLISGKKTKYQHSYNEFAASFNSKHSNSHQNQAFEYFTYNGPLACLPNFDKFSSNIVRTIPAKLAYDLQKLTKPELIEFFTKDLNIIAGGYLGNLEITTEISLFPLKLSITKQHKNINIIYLGAENFTMHPIAGQGFNLVLRNIKYLADAILKNDVSLYKSNFARKTDISSMLFSTHNLNLLFKVKKIAPIRKFGVNIVNNSTFLKSSCFNMAMNGFNILNSK